MPALLEVEEEVAQAERDQRAAERRDRNALAIAEVVGRNVASKPADTELKGSASKEHP